jgi:hypothetical protein
VPVPDPPVPGAPQAASAAESAVLTNRALIVRFI